MACRSGVGQVCLVHLVSFVQPNRPKKVCGIEGWGAVAGTEA